MGRKSGGKELTRGWGGGKEIWSDEATRVLELPLFKFKSGYMYAIGCKMAHYRSILQPAL